MLVVSDTSPLRALQALQRIWRIENFYGSALVPPTVVAELAADAPGLGPLTIADYPFLVVRAPTDAAMVARLRDEVDLGEAEALALAVEVSAQLVLIDESDGRRAAARLGLRTTGVLAMLVRARREGLVERVAPLIDELDARIRFRVSDHVRRAVLRDAGESE